jgi:glycosyltransferase involved in cell wall biosynthesis
MLDVAERVPYNDVDLIHVQHEYGLFQGLEAPFFTQLRMGGKPIVSTCHAVGNYELDVLISGVSNKVIVHNEFCKNRFGLPNAVIIPHGTTPTLATEREKAKQAMGIEKTAPVVGYLGYISNYKGLETLIQAMVKVPKAGLMICGGWHVEGGDETGYIDRLREWSKKLLEKRVKWIGYVPDDRLADAYGAMDVLCYPSRFSTESGSLLHGIAYGRAVIASNVAPFKEKEQMGILQTFENVDDLAQKIQFLLDNPNERLKLSEAASKYAEKTSWPKVAKAHVELYKKLLGSVKDD